MLFLLLACAAAVYLWHHAPALLLLIGGIGVLWYVVIPLVMCVVVAIPLALLWGCIWGYDLLHWLANALPDWRIFRAPHSDGVLTRISYQGWVALSMAVFVVGTLLVHAIVPR